MNDLAGMITGSGRVWVLSGLWVSRPTAVLGHAGFAGHAHGRGPRPGQVVRGEEGRGGWLGPQRVSAH
jgi:hypothetical protein